MTPQQSGYHFPAEFEKHEATWLSWPHKEASWPGKIETIYPAYCQFLAEVAKGEKVNINVADEAMKQKAIRAFEQANVSLNNVYFYLHPTNDAWCRDHGPAFLVNPKSRSRMIVKWNYNAWGGKYPPFDLDNQIPHRIGEVCGVPVTPAGIVMEGGAVDFNGAGTVITTTSCLLNPNRNPHLTQQQIEEYLKAYYGVSQVLWLGDGIVGDDTDGHVDDITRFVNKTTVVTAVEANASDENYELLQENLAALRQMKLEDGSPLQVITLPMPSPVVYDGQRLPASYANFYISNAAVVVPTFRDPSDEKALSILQSVFPDRKVVGVDSLDIIWGLGSFHCLSQQEPVIPV